jgi:hypothetical protein
MPWPLSAHETDAQTYTPLAVSAPDGMSMMSETGAQIRHHGGLGMTNWGGRRPRTLGLGVGVVGKARTHT